MTDPAAPPLRIVLIGASGRMGGEIIAAIERSRALGGEDRIIGGIVAPGSSWEEHFSQANVIIDFSSPAAAERTLEFATTKRCPLLIGTTGIAKALDSKFAEAAQVVPVVRTSNTSVGITAMLELVPQAAQLLGDAFDIELVELHHRGKKDAPSGTALSLGRALARSTGISEERGFCLGRAGGFSLRGDSRSELGIQAVRGGDAVGDHTVFFLGNGERLEITHRASSRAIYAEGALRAARWLIAQAQRVPPKVGLFSMVDVLSTTTHETTT